MDDLGNLAAADDADLDDSFGFRGRHDDESRVMRGRITESRGDIHPRYLTDAGCHGISTKELCVYHTIDYHIACVFRGLGPMSYWLQDQSCSEMESL